MNMSIQGFTAYIDDDDLHFCSIQHVEDPSIFMKLYTWGAPRSEEPPPMSIDLWHDIWHDLGEKGHRAKNNHGWSLNIYAFSDHFRGLTLVDYGISKKQ